MAHIKINRTNKINNQKYSSDKYRDTILPRLEYIKILLEGKGLDPLAELDGGKTETFINAKNKDPDAKTLDSNDTRYILNKKTQDFRELINLLGGKLKYVKSGTTGHTFKGETIDKNGDIFNFAVKISPFPIRSKYGDTNNIKRPENAEIMMIRVLSYFVVKQSTPHIVLPILTFDTDIHIFLKLIDSKVVDKDAGKYKDFLKNYDEGEYHETVSVLLSEWADRGDFLEFIRNRIDKFQLIHWRVFFFQIISVLAVIQSKYPAFRHNDLKANNILVQKIPISHAKHRYVICGKEYNVPNIGYQLKIWDFDFACIPGIVDNLKTTDDWTKQINVTMNRNRYYDIHYFFNTLIKNGFVPQIMEERKYPEVCDFICRVVPEKFQKGKYVHKRGRLLIDDEYDTPRKILERDSFFDEFRSTNFINN